MESTQQPSLDFSDWIDYSGEGNDTCDKAPACAFSFSCTSIPTPDPSPFARPAMNYSNGQITHRQHAEYGACLPEPDRDEIADQYLCDPSILPLMLALFPSRAPVDGPVIAGSALQATAAERCTQPYPYKIEHMGQHSIFPEEFLGAPMLGLSDDVQASWAYQDASIGEASYIHSIRQMIPRNAAIIEQRVERETTSFNDPLVSHLNNVSPPFAMPELQECDTFTNLWDHLVPIPLQTDKAPFAAPSTLPPTEHGELSSGSPDQHSALHEQCTQLPPAMVPYPSPTCPTPYDISLPMTPTSLGESPQAATDSASAASPTPSPSTTKRKRHTHGPYGLPPSSARPTKRNRPIFPTPSNLTVEDFVELQGIRNSIRSSAFLIASQQLVEPTIGQREARTIVPAGSKFGRPGASIYSSLFSQVSRQSYVCYECGFSEKRFQRAIRHQRQEHFRHFPFGCAGGDGHPSCGEQFASDEYMKDHVKKSVQQHVCERCSKTFPNKGNLTRHQKSCHGFN